MNREFVTGDRRFVIVYLDSNLVIYLVEKNPIWGPKISARLAIIQSAGDEIAVSDLARMECLVGPIVKGDAKALSDFAVFFQDPSVCVFQLNAQVCERAAHIRATYQFPALDSLHLAAAAENGCSVFLTNDLRLMGFSETPVEIIA
jgi:uncharacterized protein